MTGPVGVVNLEQTGGLSHDERLRKAANDLEGVFLSQLFKAMRETVPEGEGIFESSTAEDVFSQMLDEVLGETTASKLQGGLGEALYNQLSKRMSGSGEPGDR